MVSDSDSLTLTFVFAEREGAEIDAIAEAVSDPASARYGQYLPLEELLELVLLSDRERADIEEWLDGHGIVVLDSAGTSPQLMFMRASTEQVESAMGSSITGRVQRDEEEQAKGMRAQSRIPRRLAGYIQKVGGLPGDKSQMGVEIGGIAGLDGADESVVLEAETSREIPDGFGGAAPADIRDIYDYPEGLDGSGETIAIMMLGGNVIHEDLQCFWKAHGIEREDVVEVAIGPREVHAAHPLHQLEISMVLEWAGAMAPGARIVVYHIDPAVMGDPWAAFLLAIIGDEKHRPTIASTSWITPERQYYKLHGHEVITGLLNQAAAKGLTVISAAGDWGAFDGIPRVVRDGRYVSDAPWPHGVFMAVEERILSIGGTMVTTRNPLTEQVWSGPPPPGLQKAIHFERLAGSGGFSEDVPIPWWQKKHLRGSYPRGAGAPAVVPYGRGFPDVSLMASGQAVQRGPGQPLTAQGYRVHSMGQWFDFGGGTSTGAPIWAGIIAMANQARRAAGKNRLGFANPALYAVAKSHPESFRQITAGANDVAVNAVDHHGRAVTYQLGGYQAVPGWDPVTGLGVPHVKNLIDALVDLPSTSKG